jgi:hypothetical protein
MRLALASLGLFALALPAAADALLDRYELASEALADNMTNFYQSKVPELAAVLPEMGWDDEIAAVAQCTLDGVRAARGEDGATEYVAALETWAGTPITSFVGMADGQPAVLSDALAIQLATDCGGLELGMRRMQESGMMALIQDPSVMERLMAE